MTNAKPGCAASAFVILFTTVTVSRCSYERAGHTPRPEIATALHAPQPTPRPTPQQTPEPLPTYPTYTPAPTPNHTPIYTPNPTPNQNLQVYQAVLVELERTGFLRGYKKSSRTYYANGYQWSTTSVPEKEKVLAIMRAVELNGKADGPINFEVRDFNSNEILATYSGWTGAKILK